MMSLIAKLGSGPRPKTLVGLLRRLSLVSSHRHVTLQTVLIQKDAFSYNAGQAIFFQISGQSKSFLLLGGNPSSTNPDSSNKPATTAVALVVLLLQGG